jgi:hypothetical protein
VAKKSKGSMLPKGWVPPSIALIPPDHKKTRPPTALRRGGKGVTAFADGVTAFRKGGKVTAQIPKGKSMWANWVPPSVALLPKSSRPKGYKGGK